MPTLPLQRLERPALIIVDMQNDFLAERGCFAVSDPTKIIEATRQLLAAFRKNDLPVFFTRHIYRTPSKDGGQTAAWWSIDDSSDALREGTWHAELEGSLNPLKNEYVISKSRYSAFYATELELLLRSERVKEVVICGVATNVCCEATAHDAFFRDYPVFVVKDAMAGTTVAAHESTLTNLALVYAHVVESDVVIRMLNRKE